MSNSKRFLLPVGAGLIGASFLTGLYFGIVSWAESSQHAAEFFWQDRWIVVPIILGFGVQVGLYTVLKKRLFIGGLAPATANTSPSAMMTGAGGTTSTVAMVACCAHHVTDVLPIVGLTAASAFLAQYRTAFMLVGLGTTLIGIGVMIVIIIRESRKTLQMITIQTALERV
jgi:hypothetical protein